MNNIRVNRKLDTYEAICDYARERSEALDRLRWRLGDCANLIERKYGEHTTADFARDIGQHKTTIYQYAKVARFYPKSLRRRIFASFPNINYSHMRDAARLGNRHEVLDWLTEVSDNDWTADEAARKLTERLGHEIRETIEGTISMVNGKSIIILLNGDTQFHSGQIVTLRVKS